MRKLLLLLLLFVLPFSTEAKNKGYHRVLLQSVDVNKAAGEISNPENEKGFSTPIYRDSTFNIVFNFHPTHIDFVLENLSSENLKIIWDEVTYIGGPEGVSAGVFHSGVKFIDRENTQMPTVVVRKSKIADLLIPKSGVVFDGSRWAYRYILFWEDRLKELKIFFPIEVNGVKYEYLFVFSVQWEDIKVKTRMSDGKEFFIEKK